MSFGKPGEILTACVKLNTKLTRIQYPMMISTIVKFGERYHQTGNPTEETINLNMKIVFNITESRKCTAVFSYLVGEL